MNLLPEQKLDWVTPGLPFGNGRAGAQVINSDPNIRTSAVGTIGTKILTLGSAILSKGEVAVIYQAYGVNAMQYEFIKVKSGGNTTTPTLTKELQRSYSTGAQIIRFSQAKNALVNAHTVTPFNGVSGGFEVICGRDYVNIAGIVDLSGGDGTPGAIGATVAGGIGGGFRGGDGVANANGYTNQSGDGIGSLKSNSNDRSDNAGGGGNTNNSAPSGGGGANRTAGGNAGAGQTGYGKGGKVVGYGDYTLLIFGGGGGGGGKDTNTEGAGAGGSGGGILLVITKHLYFTGSGFVSLDGGKGGTGTGGGAYSGGGGGGGGSFMGIVQDAELGTDRISALGDLGGGGAAPGGGGGNGGIAVHRSGTVSGDTAPDYVDTLDVSLVERRAQAGMMQML